MGGFTPAAALTVLTFIQGERRAAAQRKAIGADAAERTSQIRQVQAIEERRRRERLREIQATQRARLAAQGVGAAGGSGEAVIRGLLERTEADGRDARGLDQLRIDQINSQAGRRRRANLLERSDVRTRAAFSELQRRLPRTSLIEF